MANIWYIQVNRFCNNKCHFCSNPSNENNISYEEWIKLIDDFKTREYSWIIFTWWEPTLSKDLSKWIKYSAKIWLNSRIISNGMKCADLDYTKNLAENWLELIHFSVYSCYEKIHDFLTATPWSWKKVIQAIANALKCWIRVQINTVINHYNEKHLDKTVKFLVKTFPPINHFVFNNLDPEMMQKTKIAYSTLPNFDNFKPSLNNAMVFLESTNRTFRVEKMPLCYIRWFEHISTETRKIVKKEERIIYFLDFRDRFKEEDWWHEKKKECMDCDLNTICSGIFEREKFFKNVNVYPQKLSVQEKQNIINKIKNFN